MPIPVFSWVTHTTYPLSSHCAGCWWWPHKAGAHPLPFYYGHWVLHESLTVSYILWYVEVRKSTFRKSTGCFCFRVRGMWVGPKRSKGTKCIKWSYLKLPVFDHFSLIKGQFLMVWPNITFVNWWEKPPLFLNPLKSLCLVIMEVSDILTEVICYRNSYKFLESLERLVAV